MSPIYRKIILLTFLCTYITLEAQPSNGDRIASVQMLFDEKNAWRSSADFVNDMWVTQDGKLWVAKNNNLTCWDGNNKLIFNNDPGNHFKLKGDKVQSVFELSNGDLILSTQQDELQLELLKKGSITSSIIGIDEAGRLPAGYLADVILTKNSTIYTAYNEGNKVSIYQLIDNKLKKIQTFDFEQDISENKVKLAIHNQNGWLVVKGLGVWKGKNNEAMQVMDFSQYARGNELSPNLFFKDAKGRLWLGLDGLKENIFIWNGEKFKPYPTPLHQPIVSIESDSLGQLLFISGKYPKPISEAFLLQDSNWLDYSSYLDPGFINLRGSGDLAQSFFAYTKTNIAKVGLKKIKIKKYLDQKLRNNQWGNIVMGINEDTAGNLYFLEEEALHKLDKETGVLSPLPIIDEYGDELQFKCGGAIHRDGNGDLWFKVCDGLVTGILVHFKPKTGQFELHHHPEVFRDISIDNEGTIWVVHNNNKTKKGAISRYDKATNAFDRLDLGEDFAESRFCFTKSDSILWVGTVKGLVRINTYSSQMQVFTTENSQLQSDHIIAIESGHDDWLMMGTNGNGLQLFNPEQNKSILYNEQQGLVNDYVCGIIPIDSNRYWLSTFEGLSLFDYKQQTFYNFDEADGLSHHEFNRFAFYKTTKGQIYLGSVNGVNSFNTADLAPKSTTGTIHLSSIKKYYGAADSMELIRHHLDEIKQIRLSPQVTYLEFDFYSSDFTQAGPPNFYTRLKSDDDEWLYANGQSVRYRGLPAGTHLLQIKTQHSSDILEIEIISETSFYKTWWFSLSVIAAALAFTFLLYRYRVSTIKAEEERRSETNRKFAELELQALQAQLNPHFVFNALGAIQHTIRDNNTEEAEYFLTSFAMLMRLFLESSKKKNITLAEELELISRYVELERLRFEQSFEFILDVDEDIDTHSTEIPSMLFQPFVENAINHGIFHKKEKGLLTFKIKERDEVLYCQIEDNGVGRKRAAEIQKKSIRKHPSRSTQIVNERLEILREVEGLNLKINIVDPPKGGTRVLIEIPLMEE